MGVTGLLKALKPSTLSVHIKEYSGQRAGIDISCWLHRGSIACSKDLAEGKNTTHYIAYCVKMLCLLVQNGVIPVVVFDGASLPSKSSTNNQRKYTRDMYIKLAREALANNNNQLAEKYYKQSVTISSEMKNQLQEVLRQRDIQYVVSPYEADAQLAFMSTNGYIDIVITEDSDAIVYGCPLVLYKLDIQGNAEEITQERIFVEDMQDLRIAMSMDEYVFKGWTSDQFILFCCLTGCDYIVKGKKIGIKTAYKLVQKHKTIRSIISPLRNMYKHDELDQFHIFLDNLHQGWLTFKHQVVYDPSINGRRYLTSFPPYYSLDLLSHTATRQIAPQTQPQWEAVGDHETPSHGTYLHMDAFNFLGKVILDTADNHHNIQLTLGITCGEIDPDTLLVYTDEQNRGIADSDSEIPHQATLSNVRTGHKCMDDTYDVCDEERDLWGFGDEVRSGGLVNTGTYTTNDNIQSYKKRQLEPHDGSGSGRRGKMATKHKGQAVSYHSSMIGSRFQTLSRRHEQVHRRKQRKQLVTLTVPRSSTGRDDWRYQHQDSGDDTTTGPTGSSKSTGFFFQDNRSASALLSWCDGPSSHTSPTTLIVTHTPSAHTHTSIHGGGFFTTPPTRDPPDLIPDLAAVTPIHTSMPYSYANADVYEGVLDPCYRTARFGYGIYKGGGDTVPGAPQVGVRGPELSEMRDGGIAGSHGGSGVGSGSIWKMDPSLAALVRLQLGSHH